METLHKCNISSWFFFPENWRAPSTRSFRRFLASPSRWENSLLINLWFIHFYLKDPRIYLICVNGRPRFEDDVDDRDRDHEHNCDLKMSIIMNIIMIAEMIIILFYRDDCTDDHYIFSFRLQSCGAHDHFDDKSLTCVRSTNFLVSEICK